MRMDSSSNPPWTCTTTIPFTGGALRAGFYLSFLSPYLGDDFVGFTSPPPTLGGSSSKRRGSRCSMCVGLSSREKQPAFELGWGAFRKLSLPSFLTPHLLAMAPPTRTPSSWHHRLPHPAPQGPTNHPLQPPLLSITYAGLWPRLVTAAIPLSNTRGFSRPHLLLFTRAQGTCHPLNPHSPISGKPAASEPGPHPIFAGHSPVPPFLLFLGHGVDYPTPSFASARPHCNTRGSWEHRASGLPRTPPPCFHTPLLFSVAVLPPKVARIPIRKSFSRVRPVTRSLRN